MSLFHHEVRSDKLVPLLILGVGLSSLLVLGGVVIFLAQIGVQQSLDRGFLPPIIETNKEDVAGDRTVYVDWSTDGEKRAYLVWRKYSTRSEVWLADSKEDFSRTSYLFSVSGLPFIQSSWAADGSIVITCALDEGIHSPAEFQLWKFSQPQIQVDVIPIRTHHIKHYVDNAEIGLRMLLIESTGENQSFKLQRVFIGPCEGLEYDQILAYVEGADPNLMFFGVPMVERIYGICNKEIDISWDDNRAMIKVDGAKLSGQLTRPVFYPNVKVLVVQSEKINAIP